ncbi:TM252 protein, partial [Indicator maculatus]|nr:TM252 protein [Indicator maculatus]
KTPKAVFTFIRLSVLLLGFSTICLGVLCTATNSSACRCGNNELVFYCLLALGFFLLVIGIFWSTFHAVLKYRGRSSIFMQNPWHRELHVSTIDRPDFYPPSYDDSVDPEKQTFPLPVASTLKEQEVIHMPLPPPPYNESSTEFSSETYEREQPPPYELSVQQLQQQQRCDQDLSLKAKSHLHPSALENGY